MHAERVGELARGLVRLLADDADHEPLRPGHADLFHHALRPDVERVDELPHELHELQRLACGLGHRARTLMVARTHVNELR
jgi:hypothetical protein